LHKCKNCTNAPGKNRIAKNAFTIPAIEIKKSNWARDLQICGKIFGRYWAIGKIIFARIF
jgi:hypothetical protein